jgi:hypothetical protein
MGSRKAAACGGLFVYRRMSPKKKGETGAL